MNRDADFIGLDKQGNTFRKQKKILHNRVIKSDRNQISGTLHLQPPAADLDDGVEFFQPIYEGDLIIGVIHKCSCGKTSELRFEYSDQR